MAFYDKEGYEISGEERATLLENPSYRKVAEDRIPLTTGAAVIETFWLGIGDMGPFGPEVFRTMVVYTNGEREIYKYATEEAARRHHKVLVDMVQQENVRDAAGGRYDEESRWDQIADEASKER